ncbi:MAG: DUF424 family protein [Candidatus Bathyarchaeia archaeon]|nr:DUF424 family protein [Candidatus Bathyarchaeota archaeon]
MEVYVKVTKFGRQTLLAICDADILGKKFTEGGVIFEVREEFYNGYKTGIDEALSLIKTSTIINLCGRNIVEKAIEQGYVHPEAVFKICGVLHAQIMKIL